MFEQVCEKRVKLIPNTKQEIVKNHPKTHPKNTTKNKTPHFQPPKGDQKRSDKGGKGRDPGWNPPRKKKDIAKPDLLRGKGAMREGNTQTLQRPTRSAGGLRPGPGVNF